ncbi:MAG: nitrite reductase small subunit NirD [Actinomycetes bacterium]
MTPTGTVAESSTGVGRETDVPHRAGAVQGPGVVQWTDVCAYADLLPGRGVCALVGGRQVAVVRTDGGVVHAVSNYDPLGGAYVLSRGLVGTRDGAPTLASPLHKQVYDLRTGACLDDPAVAVPVWAVRVRDGRVEVGAS